MSQPEEFDQKLREEFARELKFDPFKEISNMDMHIEFAKWKSGRETTEHVQSPGQVPLRVDEMRNPVIRNTKTQVIVHQGEVIGVHVGGIPSYFEVEDLQKPTQGEYMLQLLDERVTQVTLPPDIKDVVIASLVHKKPIRLTVKENDESGGVWDIYHIECEWVSCESSREFFVKLLSVSFILI